MRRLCFPLRLPRLGKKRDEAEVLHGTVGRVICVRDPVPGVFREAIFLLREDYLGSGGDPKALLAEARRAAAEYLAAHRSPR